MTRYLSIVILVAVVALPLDAGRKKIDYGKRSPLQDQMTNMDINRPEMNTSLNDNRMQLSDWHSSFSTLGRDKSNLTTNSKAFTGQQVEFEVKQHKLKNSKMAPGNRKIAGVSNWNYIKDNVMAGKFNGSEITSPAGRKMQQLVDEVSLQEVNRFMFGRNKTDEGITTTRAGEGQLDEIPLQFREQKRPEIEADTLDPGVLFRTPVEKE